MPAPTGDFMKNGFAETPRFDESWLYEGSHPFSPNKSGVLSRAKAWVFLASRLSMSKTRRKVITYVRSKAVMYVMSARKLWGDSDPDVYRKAKRHSLEALEVPRNGREAF